MKKIFGLILVIILAAGAQSAFANHIPMPNLPIGETAVRIQKFQEKCGKAVYYTYLKDGFWVVVTLDDKWLAVISYEHKTFPQKAWLIRNLDGHIDEYSEDALAITIKYPDLC